MPSSLVRRVVFGTLAAALVTACTTTQDDGAPTESGAASPTSSSAISTPISPSSPSATSATPAAPTRPARARGACPVPASHFDCDLQRRIAEVQTYIAHRPGTVGYVLRDRQTGAVYRNQYADTLVWTASTIKLAMTVDLFNRDRQGLLSLTATDRQQIEAMLHSSDDDAASDLWYRYAGPDHMTWNNRFPAYGMRSLQPERGFSDFYPYWGFQKCTPNDLDRLDQYLLDDFDPAERAYIVTRMQNVDPNQQWGVWGAGAAAHPGNKDGWSEEQGGWVINSVGFVGPGQRYTLAIMNSLNEQGGYDDGVATITHVAGLLFAGRF